MGNRLSSLGVSLYSYNVSNQLTAAPSVTYAYDSNGNTTSKTDSTGTTNYTWDFENRLTSVTLPGTGGTVSFKYDPFGRRIYKSSSTNTSIFAYNGKNLIEEVNSAGSVVARYAQGRNIEEPLAMLRSGATSYFEADGLGTITSLSNTAGALAQTYAFDSFGKQTGSSGSLVNAFQYTSREFDPESSLYYMRARYFDPSTGRFLSEDPIRFRGGQNFYRYVGNNPINRTDPLGLGIIHNIKCWIWGLFCLGPTLDNRLQQLQNPGSDPTANPTDDDFANPKDDEKNRIRLCVSNNDNCKNFLKECGDVVLAPVGDGMFPHPAP